RHEDLDRAVFELLLGIQTTPRLIARSGFHASMDESDAEAPSLETRHQIVQGVLELGEQQQSLVRMVEEPLLLEDILQPGEFGFDTRVFDLLCLNGKGL